LTAAASAGNHHRRVSGLLRHLQDAHRHPGHRGKQERLRLSERVKAGVTRVRALHKEGKPAFRRLEDGSLRPYTHGPPSRAASSTLPVGMSLRAAAKLLGVSKTTIQRSAPNVQPSNFSGQGTIYERIWGRALAKNFVQTLWGIAAIFSSAASGVGTDHE